MSIEIKKPTEEIVRIKEELQIRTSHYLIGALSLVTALAWNEVAKSYVHKIYPLPKDSAFTLLIYALVMTVIVVLVVYMLPDTQTLLPDGPRKKIKYLRKAEKLNLKPKF